MLWLVGNKGMLGTEVATLLDRAGIAYTGTDLEVDITSSAAVDRFVREHEPDWIVNCAAYTAVDRAEDEEERAHAINAVGPENLGRAATAAAKATSSVRVIHVSTDYVFSGDATEPIPENTPPAPVGAYGRTKAAGERMLAAACAEHVIVRTAWLYGPAGKNFVCTMLRLMRERDELSVVADQRGTPTYTVDLAGALVELVKQDARSYGAYHYTNAGETTWHRFALAIRDEALERGMLDASIPVRPTTSAEYPTRAARPAYSVLATERIQRELGITIPEWRDGLRRYLDRVAAEEGV